MSATGRIRGIGPRLWRSPAAAATTIYRALKFCAAPTSTALRLGFATAAVRPARSSRYRGWTLLELLISAGIGSILVAAIAALSLYGARSFSVIGNFADMDADSRQALDLLSREFRQASAVVDCQTNQVVKWISVTNAALGGASKVTWDSQAGTLTLTARGHDRILLEECDYWDVRLYQRVPVISSTNVAFSGAASFSDCNAIEMSWRCSRTNHGQHLNTESIQRAYLVLRNKVR